jgi:hypothetical protein
MNYMNLGKISNIIMKCVHQKVKIVEIVEFPAFGNSRVAKDILERDSIVISSFREVLDSGKLEGRFHDFGNLDFWLSVSSKRRRRDRPGDTVG